MSKNIDKEIETYLSDKQYESDYIVAISSFGTEEGAKGADKVFRTRDGRSVVREYILDDGETLTITG